MPYQYHRSRYLLWQPSWHYLIVSKRPILPEEEMGMEELRERIEQLPAHYRFSGPTRNLNPNWGDEESSSSKKKRRTPRASGDQSADQGTPQPASQNVFIIKATPLVGRRK